MKRLLMFCFLFCLVAMLSATGVVVNRQINTFQTTRLSECDYVVSVNNQIAEVKVTETFINQSYTNIIPRLYFPMPRGASATRLRWTTNQVWQEATIAGLPQNPAGGPSQFPGDFVIYIGLMPLIFDTPEVLVPMDSLKFEITYVQMLNYNFGSVSINLKNDYRLVQTASLAKQSLSISVYSEKHILDFDILGVTGETSHTDHTATGSYLRLQATASSNYRCCLQLSSAVLTSWGTSTCLDSIPDAGSPGFFLYTLEENSLPADTVFSININIVIDVSGSMSLENRLENAKAAACYVINHLQPGDNFNVILFDHLVRPLWEDLTPYYQTSANDALDYINDYQLPSLNGTNLYGGVSTALSQFAPPTQGAKNCILLISDGQPNVGVTDTYQIIHNVNNMILNNHSEPYFFCFGVGTEVNYQLLNAFAQHHRGISVFLESAEIVNAISNFYTVMRNPIFVFPEFSITPAAATNEIFPDPFPSIYGGMQYRIVGRYNNSQNISMNIGGLHNGSLYNYNFNYLLSPEIDSTMSFVPKVWASAKIDKLLIEYYSYDPESAEATALYQQIVDLSIGFGVVCVFTSFSAGNPTESEDEIQESPPVPIRLLSNIPNPFNPHTSIRFEVLADMNEEAEIRIYNLKGQLVYIKSLSVRGKGVYELTWEGKDMQNESVSSGVYIYSIRCGNYILHAKMTLQK